MAKPSRRSVSERSYSSVINKENNVNNKEEFNLVRRSIQRVKVCFILGYHCFNNRNERSFEDEKHQEDQTATNVGGRSLISLNFSRDILDVSKKGNSVRLRINENRRVLP